MVTTPSAHFRPKTARAFGTPKHFPVSTISSFWRRLFVRFLGTDVSLDLFYFVFCFTNRTCSWDKVQRIVVINFGRDTSYLKPDMRSSVFAYTVVVISAARCLKGSWKVLTLENNYEAVVSLKMFSTLQVQQRCYRMAQEEHAATFARLWLSVEMSKEFDCCIKSNPATRSKTTE